MSQGSGGRGDKDARLTGALSSTTSISWPYVPSSHASCHGSVLSFTHRVIHRTCRRRYERPARQERERGFQRERSRGRSGWERSRSPQGRRGALRDASPGGSADERSPGANRYRDGSAQYSSSPRSDDDMADASALKAQARDQEGKDGADECDTVPLCVATKVWHVRHGKGMDQ